ncbi:MAG TPA: DNA starvation/stationary phase protection protein Dps [Blastocatellia bacterium]|nr:DNA starvation/stationary phase protection protein Dps [Blastocatellia bacterium]HMV87321.1 DNA starvation/stationary phase protection protein Dps [Blastocatellia bacterium]HMX30362.1 DNA starvation/stationary phase protection protein Dps [Blastocatellia bacterium]HMY75208.1 DNA starvation/stationary phase protection protein Dps [Blastocatellia bacterium]HMZ21440.1 DNA starvation/stationary phase protection protein Dps [Blastocatellia bacterium]
MAKPKTHNTKIDIDSESREQLISLLNQQLADTFDLYSQTKQAHWNVKGPQFFQLHELFDQLAAGLLPYVDDIAERATTLGGTALGTARMATKASRLEEYPADVFGGKDSLETLVDRYATLAASTREAIDKSDELGDADTADLFTGISRGLDKSLWFLEAHLQS